jgi:pimeloyl-ACP methyl ester carboxylesterase
VPGDEERARTVVNVDLNAIGLELMRGFNVLDQLDSIECPTLVCVGELDPVPSFKGFAENVSTLPSTSPVSVCGLTFTTSPGNSVHPPATVPAYMGVIVANAVSKSGSTINGNWARVVVVQTDPGYEPNPGHPGTGTIAANFCG